MDYSANQIITHVLAGTKNIPQNIIDIGAADGTYNSNSKGLIEAGWHAILIEPVQLQYAALAKEYFMNDRVITINAAVCDRDTIIPLFFHPNDGNGLTTCNHGCSLIPPLNSVKSTRVLGISFAFLERIVGSFSDVGILSIDTEGYDHYIIDGVLQLSKPRIVVTENFFNLDNQALEDNKTLLEHGYVVVYNDGINIAWVLKEYKI